MINYQISPMTWFEEQFADRMSIMKYLNFGTKTNERNYK